MKNIILNENKNNSNVEKIENIDLELKKAINNIKGSFFDLETGNVNYKDIKGSELFEEYKLITQSLKDFNFSILDTNDKKLAFWINIYNVLVVHGIIELDIKNSVNEISGFFDKVSYKIGNYIFSLDDIEHGILRRNVKKHFFSKRAFNNNDPRINLIIEKLEPRIHFSLVCGSKSCPPIGTYQEDKIDKQLDLAASSFINNDDILIDKENNIITVSKIFKWYGKDFGTQDDLIQFIAKYRKNEEDKKFLLKNSSIISIKYLPYNWNLNH
ncbi:MAG: DUF547 domain-containing protein [Cyanobacteriota bacterium]